MVAKLTEDAGAGFPDLGLEEVDITQRPEVAVRYGAMSTPAIAIDGRLEFLGIPREDALRARLRSAAQGTDRM